MNTLELEFDKWVAANHGEILYSGLPRSEAIALFRKGFNDGYRTGFDHAKKEAIRVMAQSMDPHGFRES